MSANDPVPGPTPAFVTARLNVFEMPVQSLSVCNVRRCFVAYLNDDAEHDWPGHIVSITLDPNIVHPGGVFIDWLETTEMWKGKGYGKEFMDGLDKHLGKGVDRLGLDEHWETLDIDVALNA